MFCDVEAKHKHDHHVLKVRDFRHKQLAHLARDDQNSFDSVIDLVDSSLDVTCIREANAAEFLFKQGSVLLILVVVDVVVNPDDSAQTDSS